MKNYYVAAGALFLIPIAFTRDMNFIAMLGLIAASM